MVSTRRHHIGSYRKCVGTNCWRNVSRLPRSLDLCVCVWFFFCYGVTLKVPALIKSSTFDYRAKRRHSGLNRSHENTDKSIRRILRKSSMMCVCVCLSTRESLMRLLICNESSFESCIIFLIMKDYVRKDYIYYMDFIFV